jgi:hypothetical protein
MSAATPEPSAGVAAATHALPNALATEPEALVQDRFDTVQSRADDVGAPATEHVERERDAQPATAAPPDALLEYATAVDKLRQEQQNVVAQVAALRSARSRLSDAAIRDTLREPSPSAPSASASRTSAAPSQRSRVPAPTWRVPSTPPLPSCVPRRLRHVRLKPPPRPASSGSSYPSYLRAGFDAPLALVNERE